MVTGLKATASNIWLLNESSFCGLDGSGIVKPETNMEQATKSDFGAPLDAVRNMVCGFFVCFEQPEIFNVIKRSVCFLAAQKMQNN